MEQIPLPIHAMFSVKELTSYLHALLESDELLRDIWVQGEISNLGRPSSGHLYFTLKDTSASIRCAMWRQYAIRVPGSLAEGQAIEAHGYIDIYEAGGQLQFYVDTLRAAGEGDLYQEFLRLKARLEAEGLFDNARKRVLPEYPRRIGVITSPTGAALQDILNTFRRRYPIVEVILSPTPVQGVEAPEGIIAAMQRVYPINPDLIILARGGGSLEDLWAFNDERVAREIYRSPVPVISGIGHETDFTISDFVADARAPTPTAAAELATPDRSTLLADLGEQSMKVHRVFTHFLDNLNWQMANQRSQLFRVSPSNVLMRKSDKLEELALSLFTTVDHRIALQKLQLGDLAERLAALSPAQTLKRGYALVTDSSGGEPIARIDQVTNLQPIDVRVSNGVFHATVNQE